MKKQKPIKINLTKIRFNPNFRFRETNEIREIREAIRKLRKLR